MDVDVPARFNQAFPDSKHWASSDAFQAARPFQAGQKVGEAAGLGARPSPFVSVSQFSSGA